MATVVAFDDNSATLYLRREMQSVCGQSCLNDSDCANQGKCNVCEKKNGRNVGECEDRNDDDDYEDDDDYDSNNDDGICGKTCRNNSDCIDQGPCTVCEKKDGRVMGECEDRLGDGLFGSGGSGSGGSGSGKPCTNDSDCINEGQCSVCERKFGRSIGECEDSLVMDHLEVEDLEVEVLEVEEQCVESLVQMIVTVSMKGNALCVQKFGRSLGECEDRA